MTTDPQRLRQEALTKLTIDWDPIYPEALIKWDGQAIAMIRSQSFGTTDPEEERSNPPMPPEGRFALYSWDNDDTNGEWTGNIDGHPLWESSLTWPPQDDE